jgi:hypothetical protein
MTQGWQLLSLLIAIMFALNGIVLWAVKVWLARLAAECERQSTVIDARIEELAARENSLGTHVGVLKEDSTAFKLVAAREYLRRDDAVIYFARFEQKIDAIWSFLHERDRHGP